MGKDLKGREIGKGISQRKDGRYVARASVDGVSVVLYGRSVNKLKIQLRERVNQLKLNPLQPEESVILDEWFETWYRTYKAPILKHGASESYISQYKIYYGGKIGHMPLNTIRPINVQHAVAELLEEGKTPASIKKHTAILKQCFSVARDNDIIKTNPASGVLVPDYVPKERRVLSWEEQNMFLEYIRDTSRWFCELYEIALLTGMRVGEIGGLMWDDIDFDNSLIHVRRSLSYNYEKGGKKKIGLTSPKTFNSRRTIPFFGETKEILLRQKKKINSRRKELGERWNPPEGFEDMVFYTSRGSLVGRYTLQRDINYVVDQINAMSLEEAVVAGKIPVMLEHIYPHAFRHTFATRCFEKGMTPRTVMEIMGHSNYNTTVVYTHVLEDIKKKEAAEVGDFFEKRTQKLTPENVAALSKILMGIM